MRPIDADKLGKAVAITLCKIARSDAQKAMAGRVLYIIANAPTIEAEPVRHGRWVEVWDYNYMQYFHQCSECGRDALTKDETMHDEVLSFYCPYCGAKMGKKEEPACD